MKNAFKVFFEVIKESHLQRYVSNRNGISIIHFLIRKAPGLEPQFRIIFNCEF